MKTENSTEKMKGRVMSEKAEKTLETNMPVPFIIGITGKARSGKDTVADMMIQYLYPFIVRKVSFAFYLKRMLESLGVIDETSAQHILGCSYRHAAQTLGTEWGRECINSNVWVNLASRQICNIRSDCVIISDVRFENEAAFCRQHGVLIHVERKDQKLISESGHKSESGIEYDGADYTVYNNTTLDDMLTVVGVISRHILLEHRETIKRRRV